MKYYLLIDIGASSGRHMLGHMENDRIVYEEIHRFRVQQGRWKWHYGVLIRDIIEGMIKCKQAGKIPSSMGIDTFGVEACFLDKYKEPLEIAAVIRDNFDLFETFEQKKYSFMDPVEIYQRTGCPDMPMSYVYQLMAMKEKYPSMFDKVGYVLPMPDFLSLILTGEIKSEYSFATTSGLVNIETNNWDKKIIEKANLDPEMFVDLSMPGTITGRLRPEIAERVGYNLDVIQVATHDTASAYLAAPIEDNSNSILISSGTWSIIGTESYEPLISDKGLELRFHNEGNYELRHRIIRNLTGTYLMQQIVKEYKGKYDFPDLIEIARNAGDFPARVDVIDRRELTGEGNMEEIIKEVCRVTGQKVPSSLDEILSCIYHSIALGYKNTIDDLEECMQKEFEAIHLLSGGSRDTYLNQLSANTSGLPVYAGPTEAAVVGNMLVQMIYEGSLSSMKEARELVKRSFDIKVFEPRTKMI